MKDELMEYISGSRGIAMDAKPQSGTVDTKKASSSTKTLQEHDKRFHKKGFHEGDSCKFRERVLGEAEKEDDFSVGRGGKPNQFETPQLPEDVDIGTDPLEEIEAPTRPEEFPPQDDSTPLEKYADEVDVVQPYDIWDGEENDDGIPPEESLEAFFDDDVPPEDFEDEGLSGNGGIQDDFFSWLDNLNSNPYKSRGQTSSGARTDYIWKDTPKRVPFSDPFPSQHFEDGTTLENGDITKFSGDAIVNAANKWMLGGGGVDGAIHRAAGPDLLEECRKVRPYDMQNGYRCATGDAKITKAGNLPCKYVIHTVGPDMNEKEGDEASKLASAYRKSMQLAYRHGCRSIAFPSISTGIFAFPLEQAASIAATEIHKFEDAHPDFKVTMCLTKKNMDAYSRAFAALNGKSSENSIDSVTQETEKKEEK